MMTLTQLEYVVAVDKYRHFGKAAKACYVTQPTLSMQLQKLEQELDLIIFDRSKNPIVPTLEGEAIIRQAKIVIREHARIADIVRSRKGSVSGEFKLGVIPTLAPYVLPLFVPKFSSKFPDVNLIIEEYKTEDIIKLLEEDELDAGLVVTPLHDDSLIERVIFYEPFYLFAGPSHHILHKKKVKQEDLELSELWMLNKGNCFRDQVLNICSETSSQKAKEESIRFESGNFETLKNMVLAGSGYTILPHLAVKQLSSQRKKLIREFMVPIPTREISLVHGRSFQKERIIEALEQQIIASVPKELKCLKRGSLDVVEIYPEGLLDE
jgi:LysR family hydrogen peroxide-inducible transcriptional activator